MVVLVVRTLELSLLKPRVQSLVREVRSHKPHSTAKKKSTLIKYASDCFPFRDVIDGSAILIVMVLPLLSAFLGFLL